MYNSYAKKCIDDFGVEYEITCYGPFRGSDFDDHNVMCEIERMLDENDIYYMVGQDIIKGVICGTLWIEAEMEDYPDIHEVVMKMMND